MERIEGLVHRGHAIQAGFRTSFAFTDGPKLVAEQDAYLADLARVPGAPMGGTGYTDAERADLARMVAMWRRPAPPEVS